MTLEGVHLHTIIRQFFSDKEVTITIEKYFYLKSCFNVLLFGKSLWSNGYDNHFFKARNCGSVSFDYLIILTA